MKNLQIEIQELTLNGYQLDTTGTRDFAIYNSIEQFGFVLEFIYNDITDIRGKMPIKGGEELTLTLKDSYGTKFKKTFILRGLQQLVELNDRNHMLKMKFITKEAFYLGVNRDYISFNNKTASQIVKTYIPTIIDNNPTKELLNIVIPGWTRTKAINYITSFTDNYLVYEGNSGFEFNALSDLIVPSTNTYRFNTVNDKARYHVLDHRELQLFNAGTESYMNIYNNTYKTFNPATKTISSTTKTISTEQTDLKTFGSGQNYSSDILKNINPKITMFPYTSNALTINRIAQKLFNKKYELLINGDLDLKVGDTINLEFRETAGTGPDTLRNGLYLVTLIAHHISNKDFYTKFEVKKNAYYRGDVVKNVVL